MDVLTNVRMCQVLAALDDLIGIWWRFRCPIETSIKLGRGLHSFWWMIQLGGGHVFGEGISSIWCRSSFNLMENPFGERSDLVEVFFQVDNPG